MGRAPRGSLLPLRDKMQRQDHLFYFFIQKLLMRHVYYGCILVIFQMHSSILDVSLRVWMIVFPSKALVRKILEVKLGDPVV